MTQTIESRKDRVKRLRTALANLTEEQKQALIDRGIIATVEGRTLSLHNTLLVYIQANAVMPTVVGGYQQWKRAGRQVQKGQHGFVIWFPVGHKDEDGELTDVERFFTGTVFDISQTDELNQEKESF